MLVLTPTKTEDGPRHRVAWMVDELVFAQRVGLAGGGSGLTKDLKKLQPAINVIQQN